MERLNVPVSKDLTCSSAFIFPSIFFLVAVIFSRQNDGSLRPLFIDFVELLEEKHAVGSKVTKEEDVD